VYGVGALPITTGVEGSEVQEPNGMATNPNTREVPTDEAYYVSAADLADKIIILMQQGFDPLFLSTSTWASLQTSRRVVAN
jgi:hypothetical protein